MYHNSKLQKQKQKLERLGEEKQNYQGYIMKIIKYNSSHDIIVEFQDKYKKCVNTTYRNFSLGKIKNPAWRLGKITHNNQGCLMEVIAYDGANNVTVEFKDEYKARVHTAYRWFLSGEVKNPYYASVLKVGIVGTKYPTTINNKMTKEYQTWRDMLRRCFDEKYKEKYPTYKDVTCCKEWLLYENFYEWLHNQENFKQWLNGDRWCLDKDILNKGNKTYSPDTCCLVPEYINLIFVQQKSNKELFSGVAKNGKLFKAQYVNLITNKTEYLGNYQTSYDAFLAYKQHKENSIKQVAEKEYSIGNITNSCYIAMMNYEIELIRL